MKEDFVLTPDSYIEGDFGKIYTRNGVVVYGY